MSGSVSHPTGTWAHSPGEKEPEHKTYHSPPHNEEVRNKYTYIYRPPYVFMSCTLITLATSLETNKIAYNNPVF